MDTKLTKYNAFHLQTNAQMEVVTQGGFTYLLKYRTLSIHVHGMKTFLTSYIHHNYNICALGSNHLYQYIKLFPLHQHKKIPPIIRMRLFKQPNLLNGSDTSSNKCMVFCIKPMLSTSSDRIKIEFNTILGWWQGMVAHVERATHSPPHKKPWLLFTSLTPSPMSRVRMLFN